MKQNDHLMDATRYLIMSGRGLMRTKPKELEHRYVYTYPGEAPYGWMA